MIILDTNVVSETMRHQPSERVVAWLDSQSATSLYLTAITAAELRVGVEKLPVGDRRTDLDNRIEITLTRLFAGRLLPFDLQAARHYGKLTGPRLRGKVQFQPLDLQIASIAIAHGAAVATRNTRHFEDCGVDLIDPWTA